MEIQVTYNSCDMWNDTDIRNLTYSENLDAQQKSTAFGVSSIVLCLLGTIGNALFILSLRAEKKTRTISNYLIAHLAGVDLLNCIVTIPIYLLMAYVINTSVDICWMWYRTIPLLPVMSVYSQAVIAVNRFVLVTKPASEYKRVFSKTWTLVSVLVGWGFHIFAIAIVMASTPIPPLTGKYQCEAFHVFKMLILFFVDSFFCIYFVICEVFYMKLRSFDKRQAMTIHATKKAEAQTSATLLCVCLLSAVSVLISPCIALPIFLLDTVNNTSLVSVLDDFGTWVYFVGYSVNPLIYWYRVKLFRDTVIILFPSCCENRIVPQTNVATACRTNVSSNQKSPPTTVSCA